MVEEMSLDGLTHDNQGFIETKIGALPPKLNHKQRSEKILMKHQPFAVAT